MDVHTANIYINSIVVIVFTCEKYTLAIIYRCVLYKCPKIPQIHPPSEKSYT